MINREFIEKKEKNTLSKYACFSKDFNNEGAHPLRTQFQRDRDRIMHSKAFRSLEYKTQVFLTNINDHLRTRLTHTIEVSQIARTLAQILNVNQDLTEAIAIGHDIGHTPFGHAGERALNDLLEKYNLSFKHNVQSVRILMLLEKKYDFAGLNISLPVREGILKHTKMPDVLPEYCNDLYTNKKYSITIEGQIVAMADEIAQITHDLDDYLRLEILDTDHIILDKLTSLVREFHQTRYGQDPFPQNITLDKKDILGIKDKLIKCYVDYLVYQLAYDSFENLNLKEYRAMELDEVVIKYSDKIGSEVNRFHSKMNKLIFNDNFKIKEMDKRGKLIITSLFDYYISRPEKMPNPTYEKFLKNNKSPIVIADYISGMTDRYAISQYKEMIRL